MIKILLTLSLLLMFSCSTCSMFKYFCPADFTQSVLYKFNFIEYVLKITKKILSTAHHMVLFNRVLGTVLLISVWYPILHAI